jgi:hypothetical protein
MKCDRCGKDNPPPVHTCSPIAMRYVDELRRHGTVIDHVGCAAEIVRLYEEVEGTVVKLRITANELIERDTALLKRALEWIEAQPEPRMIGSAKLIAALKARLE